MDKFITQKDEWCGDSISSRIKNLIGKKFGYLTVLNFNGLNKNSKALWKCKCICEKIVIINSSDIHKIKSCGCKRKSLISCANKAHKNGNWSGDNIGYGGLHKFIRNTLKKPKKCPMCKNKIPYDVSNTGIYDRNLKNWKWLCRSCHMISDNRINNLRQYKNGKNNYTN